jgi:hypothetical protein
MELKDWGFLPGVKALDVSGYKPVGKSTRGTGAIC